jgi:hypothetical protein
VCISNLSDTSNAKPILLGTIRVDYTDSWVGVYVFIWPLSFL